MSDASKLGISTEYGILARLFRLFEKKRGERRTGSRLLGNMGEALFSSVLFLIGFVSLIAIVTYQVNPIDPDRPLDYGTGWWLVMLVLASFMIIGGVGVVYSLAQVGASAERRSALARRAQRLDLLRDEASPLADLYPSLPHNLNLTNSPGIELAYRLPVARSPAWRTFAAAGLCLLWNGGLAAMLVLVVRGHLAGRPDWLLTTFAAPFVAMGAWTIYYFLKQLVLLTGIGPTVVEISESLLHPGREYELYYSQSGRLNVDELEVWLVCDEEATYRHGTDVRFETARVYQQVIDSCGRFTIQPDIPFQRTTTFALPAAAMHSFQSEHNAVSWRICVRARLAGWPAVERSFPIIVYPQNGGPSGAEFDMRDEAADGGEPDLGDELSHEADDDSFLTDIAARPVGGKAR